MFLVWKYVIQGNNIQRIFERGRCDNMREEVRVMYSENEVNQKVTEMAAQINKDYEGKQIHLICLLKGSIFFFCELAKQLTVPVTMDFMTVSSYGNETKSSGNLKIKKDLDESIEGLECLLVEDIIDSGRTLSLTRAMLLERQPASLKLCTLLDKPDRREVEVPVDYVGFEIPDEFVVGYGLDYAQRYRNLPYVGILNFVEE